MAVLAGLCLQISSPSAGAADVEMGPLVHEFELTLEPGERTEAVGPLAYYERGEAHEQWAFSPFLTYWRDKALDAEELDFLYPLVTFDRFGEEYRLKIFLLTTYSGGRKLEDQSRRFTIFPFIFSQWTKGGAMDYFAFFPVGGTIRERLNRDEIRFVLFPLYSRTRKADVVTSNYLYPLFHWRKGEGLRGWQFWPLAGHETKVPGLVTNLWGDVEVVPGHRETFVLWPLYFREELGLGTTNASRHLLLLPFYANERSEARDSTTWLWPLFTYTDDRAQKYPGMGSSMAAGGVRERRREAYNSGMALLQPGAQPDVGEHVLSLANLQVQPIAFVAL